MADQEVQVVVVMGNTGVGKSTFIKYATGADVTIGHSLNSCKSIGIWPSTEGGYGARYLIWKCALPRYLRNRRVPNPVNEHLAYGLSGLR